MLFEFDFAIVPIVFVVLVVFILLSTIKTVPPVSYTHLTLPTILLV